MSSTRRTVSLVGIAALAAVAIAAVPLARLQLTLQDGSTLTFDGTSTVRSFSCTANTLDVAVMADAAGLAAAPDKVVQTAELSVPVANIDCRNGTMNGHMRKALKADANPRITWKLNSYRLAGDSVLINGRLTIAGTEKTIELRALGSMVGGVLRVKGSTPIRMTEFGVKPPSLMLGTMKVGDEVTVKYDLALRQ